MSIILTPRNGNSGLLNNPVAGTQSAATAATSDQLAASGVTAAGVELLNASGSFDRQREYISTPGGALVAEPIIEQLLSQVIALQRAQLLAQTATNALLGAGSSSTNRADDLQAQDLITRATRGALTDPSTLQ